MPRLLRLADLVIDLDQVMAVQLGKADNKKPFLVVTTQSGHEFRLTESAALDAWREISKVVPDADHFGHGEGMLSGGE